MTNTLTEQWRDGNLKDGWYYVTSKQFGMLIDRFRDQINDCGNEWRGFDNCQGIADEILASVPTYAEFKDLMSNLEYIDKYKRLVSKSDASVQKMHILEKQLAIATKALKDVAYLYIHTDKDLSTVANNALKEMEGVK